MQTNTTAIIPSAGIVKDEKSSYKSKICAKPLLKKINITTPTTIMLRCHLESCVKGCSMQVGMTEEHAQAIHKI